jgi:hypothetical protein
LNLPAQALMPSEGGKVTHVVETGGADDVVEEVTEAAIVEDFTTGVEEDTTGVVEERTLEAEDDVWTDVEECSEDELEDWKTVTRVVRVVVE